VSEDPRHVYAGAQLSVSTNSLILAQEHIQSRTSAGTCEKRFTLDRERKQGVVELFLFQTQKNIQSAVANSASEQKPKVQHIVGHG